MTLQIKNITLKKYDKRENNKKMRLNKYNSTRVIECDDVVVVFKKIMCIFSSQQRYQAQYRCV